ncbi:MAG: hypothetical protein P8M65_02090, partial [Roseibacillus sp.]|nr:hypothetical protein [Roseibacillus sp.]
MKVHNVLAALFCAVLMATPLLAQHTPERVLYRRTSDIPGNDFGGALPGNADIQAPFGELDDGSTLVTNINIDREGQVGEGLSLVGDNFDLVFVMQFYDDDGVFSFTENFDDRVKVVATPIAGSTDLTETGDSQEHSNTGWNARTYGNYDFGAGGWFNANIWLTEDGGGAQSAADIGFGYFNGNSQNTADFGGIGYAGTFGVSSGAPAAFDTDANGESWGVYINAIDLSIDIDGDNIPDAIEEIYFPGDLTQLGAGDFDADGVNDPDEYVDGTDPTEADADNDGSNDGAEKAAGTDPANPDTDSDGLLDGVETGTGTFVDANNTGSDPLASDSDGDGASDGFEITENTDPNDENSTPAIPVVQPSFVPINEFVPGAYGPDLTQTGLNYQQNKYNGGVIVNNQAEGNYNAHVSGNPTPNSSFDAIVPWASHGNGGGQISNRNSAFV